MIQSYCKHADILGKITDKISHMRTNIRPEGHSGGARKRRYKISTKKRKYKYKKLNKRTLKNPYIR